MLNRSVTSLFRAALIAVVLSLAFNTLHADEKPPAVGETARDFELKDLAGKKQALAKIAGDGPVVLVVLRGYPGYQCPVCTKQVAQLVANAEKLQAAKARVILVYPGAAEKLTAHAEEFLGDRKLPEGFYLLVDPDYTFTDAYRLRWNAPMETAYPSTFVMDKERKIRFAKISKTHGGRSNVDEVLKALEK